VLLSFFNFLKSFISGACDNEKETCILGILEVSPVNFGLFMIQKQNLKLFLCLLLLILSQKSIELWLGTS